MQQTNYMEHGSIHAFIIVTDVKYKMKENLNEFYINWETVVGYNI